MKQKKFLAPSVVLLLCALPQHSSSAEPAHDYPIKPVSFTDVHVDDQFWAPRIEINRKVSIPTAFDQCERTGRIENFVRAAEAIHGQQLTDKHAPGFPFDDTDIYKVIEGASYTLSVQPDPKLQAYINGLIQKIQAAQEPDGYLYTTRSIDPQNPHPWAGKERWVQEEVLSHELYNLGHLYEAAYANFQATGDRTLLNISLKSADLLVNTFGPGKRKIYPGHQIVEMGLVKLYRLTGRQQYLDLAKFMLDSRGGGRAYNQADQRVIDQVEPEGHAVRAAYMYSGMADVAALTGDPAYLKAIDHIWDNMVEKKYYITGGIGALGEGEAFGANYQLPNMTAYNETCAAVANGFWSQRLFLLHGDAKYVDVLERTLYNGLISGVSLDGQTYFYPNPLESNGQHQRSPWFGVACCPGNITRFTPSIPGYVYAQKNDTLYINLFMSNKAEITLDSGRKLKVVQQTKYPWDGEIKVTIDPQVTGTFTLKMRVPGWARGEAVPGDLYHFTDTDQSSSSSVHLKVNGHQQPLALDHGYATISREWRKNDAVELSLPMPVRRVVANEKVTDDHGKVALQRGPIVYCAEWADSPDKHVRNLVLDDSMKLQASFEPALLHGVEVIKGKAVAYRMDANDHAQHSEEQFQAIPYYAWANRGPGQMEVWIANSADTTHPTPFPSLASKSRITSSGPTMAENGIRDPRLVADQEPPTSSADNSSYYDWLPKRGSEEWIQYDFSAPSQVSTASVYWFVDKRQVTLPASWKLLYRDGKEWKPVEASAAFGLEPDKFNQVKFKPVTTSSLRLVLQAQPDRSAGIQEWQVH